MTETLPRQRRLAFLRHRATLERPQDWEGNAVFRELPILELEYEGIEPPAFRWENVDWSLRLLRESRDCQDFVMIAILRMLCRYGSSRLLTAAHHAQLKHVLLGVKYWCDEPGKDTCCWSSENHQVMYHTAELLAGQLWPDERFRNNGWVGRRHREHAREMLYLWLDWRRKMSFCEWLSAHYYDDDIAVLLNLYDCAEDAALRRLAEQVLDELFFELAVVQFQTGTPFAQGRAYEAEVLRPDATPISALLKLVLGDMPVEAIPPTLSRSALVLCTSAYDPPPPVRRIAACRDVMECRHRHGVNVEDAHRFGIFPDRLRDYPFFLGAGCGNHHLCVENGYILNNGDGYNYGFEYYRRCKAEGIEFDPDPHQYALTEANLYVYKTPHYVLSCAQDYRKGKPASSSISGRPGWAAIAWCSPRTPPAARRTTGPGCGTVTASCLALCSSATCSSPCTGWFRIPSTISRRGITTSMCTRIFRRPSSTMSAWRAGGCSAGGAVRSLG